MYQEHPYIAQGQPPTTRFSVVAFLDSLGTKAAIHAACQITDLRERGEAIDRLLAQVKGTLDRALHWLEDEPLLEDDRQRFWMVKAFTDNIVIGYPLWNTNQEPEGFGEVEIGETLFNIGSFQLDAHIQGLFFRGGLAVGWNYMDESIVFGDALIEAYHMEENVANFPRIVISQLTKEFLLANTTQYADDFIPQRDEVLLCSDGQYFINYLMRTTDDDGDPILRLVAQHRDAILLQLQRTIENPGVHRKYEWSANYHNYFCEQYGLSQELRVDHPTDTVYEFSLLC